LAKRSPKLQSRPATRRSCEKTVVPVYNNRSERPGSRTTVRRNNIHRRLRVPLSRRRRSEICTELSTPALQPTDMLLSVELKPDAPDQVELGLEEIDVMFLVLHQAFE